MIRTLSYRRQLDLTRIDAVDAMENATVVSELVSLLGAKLTAAIGKASNTRLVRDWQEGKKPQRAVALKTALKAARAISDVDSPAVAQGWFLGTNRFFDHVSPLEVLRENKAEGRTEVVKAAIAFVS
jgi:hypothetical protein